MGTIGVDFLMCEKKQVCKIKGSCLLLHAFYFVHVIKE